MNTAEHHTIIRLEREIAELRAELTQLHAGLADEIRTRRLIVADDTAHDIEITPGRLGATHPNGWPRHPLRSRHVRRTQRRHRRQIGPDDDARTAYQHSRSVALLATTSAPRKAPARKHR